MIASFNSETFASTTFHTAGPRVASVHNIRYSGGRPNMVSMVSVSIEDLARAIPRKAILCTLFRVRVAYLKLPLNIHTSEAYVIETTMTFVYNQCAISGSSPTFLLTFLCRSRKPQHRHMFQMQLYVRLASKITFRYLSQTHNILEPKMDGHQNLNSFFLWVNHDRFRRVNI